MSETFSSLTSEERSLLRPISKISRDSGVWLKGKNEKRKYGTDYHKLFTKEKAPLAHPTLKENTVFNVSVIRRENTDDTSDDINDTVDRLASLDVSPRNSGKYPLNSQRKSSYGFNGDEDNKWFLEPVNIEDSSLSFGDLDNEDHEPFEELYTKVERANAYCMSAKISPYEEELFKLRREKLKLEEAYLLKKKCEEELERTRLPNTKWYEIKTKHFNTEMVKHNSLMRNEIDLTELTKYWVDVYKKSKEYERFSLDP